MIITIFSVSVIFIIFSRLLPLHASSNFTNVADLKSLFFLYLLLSLPLWHLILYLKKKKNIYKKNKKEKKSVFKESNLRDSKWQEAQTSLNLLKINYLQGPPLLKAKRREEAEEALKSSGKDKSNEFEYNH